MELKPTVWDGICFLVSSEISWSRLDVFGDVWRLSGGSLPKATDGQEAISGARGCHFYILAVKIDPRDYMYILSSQLFK